jgi:Zn-dependent protease
MKIFGIPIKIDPSFLIVCAILAYPRLSQPDLLVEWLIVIFVSIIIHELGHALMVRLFGMTPQIMLYSMGGLTSWQDDRGVSPPKHIAISLAGPFAGFLFGGIVILSKIMMPDLFADRIGRSALQDLLWVNFGWGLFNLLPIVPLDGGHVVQSIEEWVRKKPGGVIARVVSLVAAGGVGLWALSIGWTWVMILMVMFAWNNGNALFQLFQYNRGDRAQPLFGQAQSAIANDDGAAAVRLAKDMSRSADSKEMESEAHRILVQGLILEGDVDQAKKEVDRLRAIYGPQAMLHALAGLERNQLPRAIPVIEYAYNSGPTPDLNFTLANALIAAGRFQEALPLIAEQAQPEYAAGLYTMLQSEAFGAGAYGLSAQAGRQAFERTKAAAVAYNIGCAEARMGQDDEALAWIERAIDAGFRDVRSLASDPDLAALRSRPEFERISGRLREAIA